jgi:hypothetical protein
VHPAQDGRATFTLLPLPRCARARSTPRANKGTTRATTTGSFMLDVVFILVTGAFFGLCVLYVRACDRL